MKPPHICPPGGDNRRFRPIQIFLSDDERDELRIAASLKFKGLAMYLVESAVNAARRDIAAAKGDDPRDKAPAPPLRVLICFVPRHLYVRQFPSDCASAESYRFPAGGILPMPTLPPTFIVAAIGGVS